MSTATKTRILAALVVLFMIWPLAHRAAVARYDLSPWKFMGWSMYCRPENRIQVRLFETVNGTDRPLNERFLSPGERRAIQAFRRNRMYYGTLARPSALARLVRRTRPRLSDLSVVVRNVKLDPGTNTFQPTDYRYDYPAPTGRGATR